MRVETVHARRTFRRDAHGGPRNLSAALSVGFHVLRQKNHLLIALAALGSFGCHAQESSSPASSIGSVASALTAGPNAVVTPSAIPSAVGALDADAPRAGPPALSDEVAVSWMRALSEPEGEFFSDNFLSNETSYLHVAPELANRPTGGAYIGVGPEQNFSYIALSRPQIAFIVDIRKDHALLHLLYTAMFQDADTRSRWLTLLLGRPYDGATDPGRDSPLAAVLAHAVSHPQSEQVWSETHAALLERIRARGVELSSRDRERLRVAHRTFFDGQLDTKFELSEPNGRNYPTLQSILRGADAAGRERGFLATDEAYRFVRDLQRANRVLPVVGDFAGAHALRAVAAQLEAEHLVVRSFYVSNVEQYLLGQPTWPRFLENVEALPTDEHSVFIRCYLDQGRRHPAQADGHRTVSLVQPMPGFVGRASRYRNLLQVSTEEMRETP
jgi:hypothetical protein